MLSAFVFEAGALCQTYVQFSVGDNNPTPVSINKKGEIAGTYLDFAYLGHGFVRSSEGGAITRFDAPNSNNTVASSINAAGAITGAYSTPVTRQLQGFIRDPEGNFTTFDPPGSIFTRPLSINATGAIAGFYHESNLVVHGFLREPNGKIISFDPPGSILTQAFSINAGGVITGSYLASNQLTHGFVREPSGHIISFDAPGSDSGTFPTSINNAGAITGYYNKIDPSIPVPRRFGFARDRDGNFTSFDPGPFTYPWSINNEGAITGNYLNISASVSRGFVRSPEGTITLFDPPFCGVQNPATDARSINDKGVITGKCSVPGVGSVGWVRFPPTPPAVSCSATPNMLWPPNGKPVAVTVSGTVTSDTQPISSGIAAYAVTDEYGQVKPSGSITLGVGGSYSFGVSLIAARNGDDHDGRTYTIVVEAKDAIDNLGSCSTVVTVPHDQGK